MSEAKHVPEKTINVVITGPDETMDPFNPKNNISKGTVLWFYGSIPKGWKLVAANGSQSSWLNEVPYNSERDEWQEFDKENYFMAKKV